jgi:hypothetical protein
VRITNGELYFYKTKDDLIGLKNRFKIIMKSPFYRIIHNLEHKAYGEKCDCLQKIEEKINEVKK